VADEMYDGPFCVLCAVDPHQQRRLLYEVLDHDPSRLDIFWFLARLKEHIQQRGHVVRGITTDASALYPVPIRLALGPIPHQVCEFHIKKDLLGVVLRILARHRKRLAGQKPQLPRGRPGKGKKAQRLHQQAQEIQQAHRGAVRASAPVRPPSPRPRAAPRTETADTFGALVARLA
jgi:hypothetical protein